MKEARAAIALCVLLGMAGLTGCGSKMSKMAQGPTPVAANFYVLNQEVGRVREGVRSAAPEQSDSDLPRYDDLLAQMRAMAAEIAVEPDLKAHEALRAATGACLGADTVLLAAERDAIASYAAESRLGIEINDLALTARGNTIRMHEIQGQLGELTDRQQQNHTALLKVLPQLGPAAERCRTMLQQYNVIVAAEKIVSYFNSEDIYGPFGWEQARPVRHTPAAKHRVTRKSPKRR